MKCVQEDTCFGFDFFKPFKIQGKQPICYRRQEILCISVYERLKLNSVWVHLGIL